MAQVVGDNPDDPSFSYETSKELWLFTSLTAGSSHIVTATSRMETILKANRIPFKARDTATDEKARRIWTRRSQGKKLPGLVREGMVIADLEGVEEWNEYGEIKQNLLPKGTKIAPAKKFAPAAQLKENTAPAAPPAPPAPAATGTALPIRTKEPISANSTVTETAAPASVKPQPLAAQGNLASEAAAAAKARSRAQLEAAVAKSRAAIAESEKLHNRDTAASPEAADASISETTTSPKGAMASVAHPPLRVTTPTSANFEFSSGDPKSPDLPNAPPPSAIDAKHHDKQPFAPGKLESLVESAAAPVEKSGFDDTTDESIREEDDEAASSLNEPVDAGPSTAAVANEEPDASAGAEENAAGPAPKSGIDAVTDHPEEEIAAQRVRKESASMLGPISTNEKATASTASIIDGKVGGLNSDEADVFPSLDSPSTPTKPHASADSSAAQLDDEVSGSNNSRRLKRKPSRAASIAKVFTGCFR